MHRPVDGQRNSETWQTLAAHLSAGSSVPCLHCVTPSHTIVSAKQITMPSTDGHSKLLYGQFLRAVEKYTRKKSISFTLYKLYCPIRRNSRVRYCYAMA